MIDFEETVIDWFCKIVLGLSALAMGFIIVTMVAVILGLCFMFWSYAIGSL